MSDQVGIIAPASAVKQEVRRGGPWEDVKRPTSQTFMAFVFRLSIYAAITLQVWLMGRSLEWWVELNRPDITAEHPVMLWAALIIYAVAVTSAVLYGGLNVLRSLEVEIERGVIITLITIAVSVIGLTAFLLPGIHWLVWAMYVDPVIYIWAIVMVAIVTTLPTGVYSFVRELVDQTGTNSESIRLKELEIDWQRERDDAERIIETLKRENDRLRALLADNFRGTRDLSKSISRRTYNGSAPRYEADTRSGPRLIEPRKFLNFIKQAWGGVGFKRKHWLDLGLMRDEWECYVNALKPWALDDVGPRLSARDVITELQAYGVFADIPPAELHNAVPVLSLSGTAADRDAKG